MISEITESKIIEIPSGWNVLTLGDLFNFKNGLNKEKHYFGYGIPIVNYMDVYRNRGLKQKDILGKVFLSSSEIKAYEVKRGDVFFTRTSETVEEIGIASVILEDVRKTVFSGFILRGRPKNNFLDDQFKKYCFSTSTLRKEITSSSSYTTRALTNGRLLSKVKILFPLSRTEQSAIATALSDADALVESLEKLIAKKQAIKQGTMQLLLTGKKRLPGFNGEWEVKQVSEFTDVTAGGTPSTLNDNYWGGSIRWMNSGELNLKKVLEVEGRITELGFKNSSTKLVPQNCILIGLAGQGKTRGTVAMNSVPVCINQSIAAIYPSASFVPDYLYYNLDSRYDELRTLSTGDGGRGGLNLAIIKRLFIPFPSKIEQAEISKVLKTIDDEIEALQCKVGKHRQIKQGMMQNLLTGKIRLI